MSDDGTHIVCPHCGGVNRIAAGRDAGEGKCGKCHNPLFTGQPVNVDAAAFDRHVLRNDIPVVVDFWADWCGPCHAMAPAYARAAAEIEPRLRFLKLDTEAEPAVSARFGIRSIPTLIVFRNGRAVAQQAGAMGDQQLRSWLQQSLGG
ncbi:MAG: thioredoxin TrxC [Bauldia sp.]|nr:thioredoxin TrxC [Bauldia sp.]MCW5719066.1 thioredoxin TrxC [Bauldia sp.]